MSQKDRQIEQLPLSQGMEEASSLLSDHPEVLGRFKDTVSLKREDFQSEDFRRTGYHLLPHIYTNHDRSIWHASLSNGTRIFIITGKVSSDNPYELGHAGGEGMDLRKALTTVAEWDGDETIKIYSQGNVETYRGEFGNPDLLLEATRKRLGEPVGEQQFA